jgi:8-oxo-dGTP pyrophosphatase MutT (NUDIX family)
VATPISLGCRILVVREDQVLLVQHSYQRGWYLPGGAVDRGESLKAAAVRELREECAIEGLEMRFVGMFLSEHEGRSDHVALFSTDSFRELSGRPQDSEISQFGFFSMKQLPEGTSPATRRRIQEFLSGIPNPEFW